MQIRKVLRNYLATVLMDVPFLEKNIDILLLLSERVLCWLFTPLDGWIQPEDI